MLHGFGQSSFFYFDDFKNGDLTPLSTRIVIPSANTFLNQNGMNLVSWFDFSRTPGFSQFNYLNISDPFTEGNKT